MPAHYAYYELGVVGSGRIVQQPSGKHCFALAATELRCTTCVETCRCIHTHGRMRARTHVQYAL